MNRVVSMVHRYFDGVVPEPHGSDDRDAAVLSTVAQTLDDAAQAIRQVHLRQGLQILMTGAQAVNAYLSELEPWKTARTDLGRTGTTLWHSVQAIGALASAFSVYLPTTSQAVLELLSVDVAQRQPQWATVQIAAGTILGEPVPLFSKAELPTDDE